MSHIEESKKNQIDSMVSKYFYYETRKNKGYDVILTEEQYEMLDSELTKILNKYIDMNGMINKVEDGYVKSVKSDGKHF